ncbi:MAG TPA: hypothetical protein VI306_16575 [Pyrinomonadaceae bacterium]
MLKLRYSTLLLLLMLTASSSAFAQTKPSVAEIDAYALKIDRFTKANKKHRLFADVSSQDDEKEQWKEFKNDKQLEAATWYEASHVFTRTGKIVVARFTFTSPSGDWYHFIDYYFRDDGSLAKIHARLNTFYGNISVIRNRYFDSAGSLIKETKSFHEVKTDRVAKEPAGFMDEPIPLYKTVSDLPFSKLL